MEAQIWKISLRDYHADTTRDSSSSLRLFEKSPLAYYRQRIAKTQRAADYSAATKLGSAVHAMLGGDFAEQCVILPPGPYRTKASKARRDECMAANEGKVWLTQEEHDLASNIVNSIMRHELASQWVCAAGENELTIKWDDIIPLKVRFDRLLDDGTIIEYKTMAFGRGDPLIQFRKDAREYGYDLQAALYSKGARSLKNLQQLLVGADVGVRYIVANTDPPHDVMALRATEDFIASGERRLQVAMCGLARRKMAEVFAPGEHNWSPFGGVLDLDPI